MQAFGLGGYKNIDGFVKGKIARFDGSNRDFAAFFDLMFSEGDNIFYERSVGYRILTTTYGEARHASLCRADALAKILAGAPKGSAVGIAMPNSLEWIETFWAVLACGFCPVLFNLRLPQDILSDAAAQSGAVAVIGGDYGVMNIDPEMLVSDTEIQNPSFGDYVYVMSSGTSESVKICAYSAQSFYYQVKSSYSVVCQSEPMQRHYKGYLKQLCFLPFYHIFGLCAVYVWFAFFSRTFVHLADLQPQTIVNTVRRHGVTHIFAVPLFWQTVYNTALKTIKGRGDATYAKFQRGIRLSRRLYSVPLLGKVFSKIAFKEVRQNIFGDSISFMITGGSAIGTEVLEFFNLIGYRLANGYGMSEIGITSVELSDNIPLITTGSVGKPLQGVEYRIDGGRLFVKSNAVSEFIIENGTKVATPEWFDTKDLAAYRRGRYYILGRQDDLVIGNSGENLNPCLIEPRFAALSGVSDACLVSANVPTLIVSCSAYLTPEAFAKLQSSVSSLIAQMKLSGEIKDVYYTSAKLLQGDEFKLARRRLTREVLSGTLPRITGVSVQNGDTDALFALMARYIAAALDIDASAVTRAYNFFTDGGGSSLDYMAMTSQIQQDVGVSFASAPTFATAGELYDYVKASLNVI